MGIGAYLTGAFGQTQKLYDARNELKRKRGSGEAVEQQLQEDTSKIIELQKEANLDFIMDPMLSFFYLFQAFAENVPGVKVGPQENWFNNNVFYRIPQIPRLTIPTETPKKGFTEEYLQLDLLPKDGRSMVVLPSPYSLLMLSNVTGYPDKKSAIKDLSGIIKAEADALVQKGVARIQYDEPVIVVRQSLESSTPEDLELLRISMEICGSINGATTSLHTYFGDAGPIIPYLISLPVDCIGIDATETSVDNIMEYGFNGKELALGLVNARNTYLEDPGKLLETLDRVVEACNPTNLWLTTNTATEYNGYTHGVNKLRILKEVRGPSHE